MAYAVTVPPLAARTQTQNTTPTHTHARARAHTHTHTLANTQFVGDNKPSPEVVQAMTACVGGTAGAAAAGAAAAATLPASVHAA